MNKAVKRTNIGVHSEARVQFLIESSEPAYGDAPSPSPLYCQL